MDMTVIAHQLEVWLSEDPEEVWIKQPELGNEDSMICLTVHQLPAFIAELQKILLETKKAPGVVS